MSKGNAVPAGRRCRRLRHLVAATISLVSPAFAAQPESHVRVSAWYWLNSVPRTQWSRDFKAIHNLGFTDVLLVWGLDAAAFSLRIQDSHQAIRVAQAAGLGSYLFVWDAQHSSLLHRPQFQQVDAAGQLLFAFDAFNQQWRNTQWKNYLQTLAREYGPEPGMAGYVFDHSFAIGRVGSIDGPAPKTEDNYISYGSVEKKMFGKQPPASPDDPAWNEWIAARKGWWAAWALETKFAIRAEDKNAQHEILLEDGENTIAPDTVSRTGLGIREVARSFDTMGAYWAPAYSDKTADEKLSSAVTDYLLRIRAGVGPDKNLAFTLRCSESEKEDTPGHASEPTLDQIRRAVDAALALGIRHIDLCGYRMGVSHLDSIGWNKYQPGSGTAYPLTGQIEGKFLCDRPELWGGLRAYLHKIESTPAK